MFQISEVGLYAVVGIALALALAAIWRNASYRRAARSVANLAKCDAEENSVEAFLEDVRVKALNDLVKDLVDQGHLRAADADKISKSLLAAQKPMTLGDMCEIVAPRVWGTQQANIHWQIGDITKLESEELAKRLRALLNADNHGEREKIFAEQLALLKSERPKARALERLNEGVNINPAPTRNPLPKTPPAPPPPAPRRVTHVEHHHHHHDDGGMGLTQGIVLGAMMSDNGESNTRQSSSQCSPPSDNSRSDDSYSGGGGDSSSPSCD